MRQPPVKSDLRPGEICLRQKKSNLGLDEIALAGEMVSLRDGEMEKSAHFGALLLFCPLRLRFKAELFSFPGEGQGGGE